MKIYFYPHAAIRYKGESGKLFTRSVIRPVPFVNKGDVIIMTPVDAHNTVRLFPTEWEKVEHLEIDTDVITLNEKIEELESELEELSFVVAQHDIEQEEKEALIITPEEAVSSIVTMKTKEYFKGDKNALAEYALDEYLIEFSDLEKSFDELYDELFLAVNHSSNTLEESKE